MVTTANTENIQEDQERRKLYLNSARASIQEDLNFMVANALAHEVIGKITQGFTVKTYKAFWKPYFNDKWIYYLNHGRFA